MKISRILSWLFYTTILIAGKVQYLSAQQTMSASTWLFAQIEGTTPTGTMYVKYTGFAQDQPLGGTPLGPGRVAAAAIKAAGPYQLAFPNGSTPGIYNSSIYPFAYEGEQREDLPFVGPSTTYNHGNGTFTAKWLYAMVAPNTLSPYQSTVCGNGYLSMYSDYNGFLFSDNIVSCYVVYQYNIQGTGTDNWKNLDSISTYGTHYGIGFDIKPKIPEVSQGTKYVRFRCRAKAVYSGRPQYSPWSAAPATYVEILSPPPSLNVSQVQKVMTCPGESNGSVRVPAGALSGPNSTMRWILRPGNVTDPCFPGTSSNCGDGLAQSQGTVPVSSTEIYYDKLSEGSYTLWFVNPGQEARSCFSSYPFTVSSFPAVTLAEDVSAHKNISCYNANDGRLTANATGGDPAGQYLFTLLRNDNTVYIAEQAGNGATMTWNNLPAGLYRLRVRNNKCSDIKTSTDIELTQPKQVTGDIFITEPTCNVPGNGSITLTANATGVARFRYELYKNGMVQQQSGSVTASSYTFSGLTGGDYVVQLFNDDIAGCPPWNGDTTLITPAPLTLQMNARDSVSCNGGSDGTLAFSATGGSGAYTFTLSGAAIGTQTNTNGIFNNLPAGNYTIQLTNQAAGCNDQISQQVDIFQRSPLSVQLQSTLISCFEADDATVKATVSGGSGAYKYTWQQLKNNVWTGNSFWFETETKIEALPAGTYRVIITDAKAPGCSITSDEVVISEVTELKITDITVTDAVCLADGVHISMSASGGTGTYTYSWSTDGGTTYTPFTAATTFTTTATYLLQVKDGNGCKTAADNTYNIVLPAAALDFTMTVSDYHGFNISCKDASDGNITVNAQGGNGGSYNGYQYSINNGAYQPGAVFNNLVAGTYTVTVKDARGCQITKSVTLLQPAIAVTLTKSDILCNGAATGTLRTNITGGAAPYVLKVNGAEVTAGATMQQLPAGNYAIHITDANGCTKDTAITIVYTYPALQINSAVVTDIVCYGTTGHIDIDAIGGDGVHAFSLSTDNWTNATGYTSGAGLTAGNYALRVTDGQGCVTTHPAALLITTPAAPLALTATLSDYNGFNISCNGGSNAFADIKATGGNGASYTGYTYAIDNGAYTATPLIQGINAGTHTLHVKDGRGCVVSRNYQFTQSALAIDLTVVSKQDVPCAYVPAGSITVAGSGGAGGLQYSIDNSHWQTGTTFSNLVGGTYTIWVKDLNSCGKSITVSLVPVNAPIVIDNITVNDIVCYGQKGTIQVQAHGGTGILTNEYAWNGGAYSNTFNNTTPLGEGAYTIRVKDAAGCYSPVSAVKQISTPTAALNTIVTTSAYNGVQISCNGLSDGSISLATSGGNGGNYTGYTYSINNSAYSATNSYNNLSAGNYTIKVVDGRGCALSRQVVLQQPAALTLAVSSKADLPCGANPTGKVQLQATGGTTPYAFAMNNGNWQSASLFETLPANTYALSVKDGNGCRVNITQEIKAMYPPIDATADITNVSCNALSDAKLMMHITGGDGRYTYEWNAAGMSGSTLQQIPAGIYTVKVTDGAGCFRTFTHEVTQPEKLTLEVAAPPICDGLSDGTIDADVNGGTLPYKYSLNQSSWLTTGSFTQMDAGQYKMTVQDAHGCEVAQNFEIGKVNVKPDINFLVASRRNAMDTLIIREISLPAPDRVRWNYSPAATLLGYENDGTPLIKFSAPGTYWVEMTATFGECTYSERKDVIISPYDPLSGPGYTVPVSVIDTVMLSPNPNNGYFKFTVKLNRKQQVVAYVYDMNGIISAKHQYAPALQIEDNITVGGTASGTFILRIITESESRDVRFIISR